MLSQNHYEILGVAKDADSAAIKSAYRKQLQQWHQDKVAIHLKEAFAKENPELLGKALDDAFIQHQKTAGYIETFTQMEEKYKVKSQQLSEAYDVLSDSIKRGNYDRLGTSSASRGAYNYGQSGTNTSGRSYQQYKPTLREELRAAPRNRGWAFADEIVRRHGGYTGKDLSFMHFHQFVFSDKHSPASIQGANLSGTMFNDCWFENARIGKQLQPINNIFFNCNFDGANFAGAEFSNALFHGTGSSFKGADFSGITGHYFPKIHSISGRSAIDGMKIHERHLDQFREMARYNDLEGNHIHVVGKNGTRTLHFNHHGLDNEHIAEQQQARDAQAARQRAAQQEAADAAGSSRAARTNTGAQTAARGAQAESRAGSTLEHTRSSSKTGWIIAGTALVIGGAIAAISMSENKDNQRRKTTNRMPMPQPDGNWQNRIDQPNPTGLSQSL